MCIHQKKLSPYKVLKRIKIYLQLAVFNPWHYCWDQLEGWTWLPAGVHRWCRTPGAWERYLMATGEGRGSHGCILFHTTLIISVRAHGCIQWLHFSSFKLNLGSWDLRPFASQFLVPDLFTNTMAAMRMITRTKRGPETNAMRIVWFWLRPDSRFVPLIPHPWQILLFY